MSQPLADTRIEITTDISQAERELPAKAARAGQRAGEAYADGFDQRARNVTRDAAGRLRDGRGRYVSEAGKGGAAAGQAFSVQFGKSSTSGLDRLSDRLAKVFGDIGRSTETAVAGIVKDLKDFGGAEGEVVAKAEAVGQRAGKAYGEGFEQGAQKYRRDAAGRLRDERGRYVSEGEKAGEGFAAGFGLSLKGGLKPVSKVLAGVFGGAALIGGLAQTISMVSAFTAALAPAAGAVLVLPAVFGVAQAAIGTFNLAVGSTGEAFKAALAGDPAKLAKEMEGLSPAARGVVTEVSQLKPALDDLKKSGQEAFFSQLSGEVTRLAKNFAGPLSAGVTKVSGEFGAFARSFTANFDGPRVVEILNQTFDTTAKSVRNVRDGVISLAFGFLEMSAAGLPAVDRLSTALGNAAERLGDFLTESAQSGQALDWINNGIDVAAQFGRVLGNVGGILKDVFAGANTAGTGLLVTLEMVTGGIRDFTSSAEGARFIESVFESLRNLGNAVGPAIAGIARGMADVAEQLAVGLGEIDLGPLGDQLGALLSNLAPLLPGLGKLIDLIGFGLAKVLEAVNPLIGDLANEFGGRLTEMLSDPAAKQGITDIATGLKDIVEALRPWVKLLADLDESIASPSEKMQAFGFIAKEIGGYLKDQADYLNKALELWNELGEVFSRADETVSSFGDKFVEFGDKVGQFILDLPTKIQEGLALLGEALLTGFTTAFDLALQAVGIGIGLILFAILELPGLALEALIGFGVMIGEQFTLAWETARRLTSEAIAAVIEFVTNLPSRSETALSNFATTVRTWFERTWEDAKRTVSDGVDGVIRYVEGLPGRISAYGSNMLTAGRNLIKSFMDGLSQAGSFASDVGSAILRSVKSGLNSVIGSINSGIAKIDDVLPGSLPRIPQLAQGAIINRATLAVVGEAGKEIVLPMTKPRRAIQLAQQGGLIDLLVRSGAIPAPAPAGNTATTTVNAPITINTAMTDGDLIAQRAVGRLVRLAGI